MNLFQEIFMFNKCFHSDIRAKPETPKMLQAAKMFNNV